MAACLCEYHLYLVMMLSLRSFASEEPQSAALQEMHMPMHQHLFWHPHLCWHLLLAFARCTPLCLSTYTTKTLGRQRCILSCERALCTAGALLQATLPFRRKMCFVPRKGLIDVLLCRHHLVQALLASLRFSHTLGLDWDSLAVP